MRKKRRKLKPREAGEEYRPTVKVQRADRGVPTAIIINGRRYISESKEYLTWREAIAKRDLLIKMLKKLDRCPQEPHKMKVKDLEKMIIGGK